MGISGSLSVSLSQFTPLGPGSKLKALCVCLCFGAASPVGVLTCPGGSHRLMDYVYGSGLMVSAVEALTHWCLSASLGFLVLLQVFAVHCIVELSLGF